MGRSFAVIGVVASVGQGLITGRLADGVIVNHVVNWLSPMKERITIVTGERGALTADTSSGDVTFYANGTVATE